MHAFVFPLVLVCLVLFCSAQQQNYTSSFPYSFNQTNNIKSGKTNRLKLGILGSWVNPGDTVVAKALAHELNNDPTILPDVGIDLYISATPTSSDALLGTLYHINTLGVQGIMGGALSTESRTIQLVSKIWNVPQISSNSLSYTLNNKDEYPYFMRTIPTDAIQIDGIIALFKKFGWKKAVVVYTNDDYGSGYQRLTVQGAAENITFYPVSVSTAAVNISQVQDALNAVKQAVQQQNYRIFVYYAQGTPANLIRAGLNASGLIGPDYVSIITSSITGFYTYGRAPLPLNDGTIGFHFSQPSGAVFNKFYNSWNSTNTTNPFPMQPLLSSSYFMADCLLSYAHSFDRLLKNGTAFSAIKGPLLLNMLKQNSFPGMTGNVNFDSRGERLGRYAIFSFTPTSFDEIGYYDGNDDSLVISKPIVWGGGSTAVPRDSPFLCDGCKHGRCVVDVGCVCLKGWKGDNCDVHIGSNAAVYGGIGGAVAVMLVIIIAAVFVYRRQRSRLVKSVADKQRSNISRVDIKLLNRIGRGASGEVFKATFRGTEVAVKKIITSTADKSAVEEFELEVAIMCGLRHPNIILFMGSCFDTEAKEMLLVMEFMAKGSLHDVIHNPKFTMSFDMQLHLACQAAQGMNFLHQSTPPIIHRDLKSHNILLDDKWNARISDFGITKFQENTKTAKAVHDKSIGTIYWSSPESLEGGEVSVKADVYSFGIVLWEIFHRQNPYTNRDPISVAIDVINNNLRPPISDQTPLEMRDLMVACWDKDPHKRPSFQEVVDKLREMSMKNPSYSMGATRVQAPTEKVYIVNTSVQGAYKLWQDKPKAMTEAMILHNGLIRSNMELYRGYESKYDFTSFMIAFQNLTDALNFCISTQVSLMHVQWPIDIVKLPQCAQTTGSKGQLLWNGLRVQMSVYSGVPNCQHDPSSDRMTYMGPVVERALKMLRGIKNGSIVVSDTIVDELNKKGLKLIEPCTTSKCGEMSESARTASIHLLSITSLSERDSSAHSPRQDHPHVLLDMDEEAPVPTPNSSRKKSTWEDNVNAPDVDWIVTMKDLDVKGSIGKGSMGDYSRATLKSKDVAIKLFVNQHLKEGDLLRLMSDSAMMTQMSHPNLLTFHAVCLDQDHLSMISEYMPRGNLKAMLSDTTIALPLAKRMRMAHDIAQGMRYLSNYPDADMQKHDNLKSNNILVGKDWEVKVCDYGQSNLKDLARTMTSVGSVAWTAPELLAGEPEITPKIATYSFGIILWEIYTRQVPYANEHPIRVVSKILCGYRPLIPQDCPPALSELISSCLVSEPLDRPSWDSIITTLSSLL